jgi:hypothetical protein
MKEKSGFDAGYTYFIAQRGGTRGAHRSNWLRMHRDATRIGFTFIPSLGPGY